MFDYNACLVPDIKLRMRIYVWVAYGKEPPYLPIAVADTPWELAKAAGVSPSTVKSTWNRFQRGELKRSRFWKIKVGYDLLENGGAPPE